LARVIVTFYVLRSRDLVRFNEVLTVKSDGTRSYHCSTYVNIAHIIRVHDLVRMVNATEFMSIFRWYI